MIEILSDLKQLSKIKFEWDALVEKIANPLFSYDWHYNAAKFLHTKDELFVVAYREDEKVKCVLPLVKKNDNLTFSYLLIGSESLYEPNGAIYEDEDYFYKLLQEVKIKYPLVLRRLPIQFLDKNFNSLKTLKNHISRSSFINVSNTWDNFYNALKSKRRSDHRRALKKAGSYGNINFEIIKPNENEFEELYRQAMEIESCSWKGIKKSALLYNLKLQEFFRAYLTTSCKMGNMRVGFLSVGMQKIAMLIGVVYFSKFWILKIGFNDKYSNCSPGMLLTMETIKYAFEQNLSSYEFLGSYEKWQDMWPVELREYATIALYPYSFKSVFHLGINLLKSGISRVTNNA